MSDSALSVSAHFDAIVSHALLLRAQLGVDGREHVAPFPDELVEILAKDERHQEARRGVSEAAQALRDAGVPFELLAAHEASGSRWRRSNVTA